MADKIEQAMEWWNKQEEYRQEEHILAMYEQFLQNCLTRQAEYNENVRKGKGKRI